MPGERNEPQFVCDREGCEQAAAPCGVGARRRLTPIVVLVTDDTLHALNDYVTATESIIRMDAPDVERSLDGIGANGWTTTMLIAGSLLAQALDMADGI